MKNVFIILIFFFLSSCKKVTVANQVSGEWKLVQITYPFTSTGERTIDVHGEDIVYHFQNNNILKVNDVSASQYSPYTSGEYRYEIRKDYLPDPGPGATQIDLVIIEDTRWVCSFSKTEMILSTSYFDGPILTFEENP